MVKLKVLKQVSLLLPPIHIHNCLSGTHPSSYASYYRGSCLDFGFKSVTMISQKVDGAGTNDTRMNIEEDTNRTSKEYTQYGKFNNKRKNQSHFCCS